MCSLKKRKKVSFYTYHEHSEYGYNQKEEALALDDEWVMNEPEMELIRLHKRDRRQTFVPILQSSSTPSARRSRSSRMARRR